MNPYYLVDKDFLIGPVTMEKPACYVIGSNFKCDHCRAWEVHLAAIPRYPIQGVNPWRDGEMVPESQFYLMDTDKWYWCKCEGCGWEGSSQLCKGGGSIADTDDYDDALCPECMSNDLDGDTNNRPEEYIGTVAIPVKSKEDEKAVWDGTNFGGRTDEPHPSYDEMDYKKSIEGNYVFDRNEWQVTFAGDIILVHKKDKPLT